jgi:hypothetical protein
MPQQARPASKWTFQSHFRRAGFGWRGSRLASQRMSEALAEIRADARRDPAQPPKARSRLWKRFRRVHEVLETRALI